MGRFEVFECVGCGGSDSVMDEGELLGFLGSWIGLEEGRMALSW